MPSAENDALLDTLERLVHLLERGEYVPFSLITEARSVVDAARAKCETCGGPVEVRAGESVCVSGSYLPHPATRPFPPTESCICNDPLRALNPGCPIHREDDQVMDLRNDYHAALAAAIWRASRADEGTISATGANFVANALLMPGGVVAEMVAELIKAKGKPLSRGDKPCPACPGVRVVQAGVSLLCGFDMGEGDECLLDAGHEGPHS